MNNTDIILRQQLASLLLDCQADPFHGHAVMLPCIRIGIGLIFHSIDATRRQFDLLIKHILFCS